MFHVITVGDIKIDGKDIKNVNKLIVWTDEDPERFITRKWWWDSKKMISHNVKDIKFWNINEFDLFVPVEPKRSITDKIVVKIQGFFFG
jgi:hypothetical protein